MIRRISLVVVITLFSLALFIAPASAGTSISANPSVITKDDIGPITITLFSDSFGMTGTIRVVDPNGDSWTSSIAVNIPLGGGSQSWKFPDDFPSGASLEAYGSYDVYADVTLSTGFFRRYRATFLVEFFVIPFAPLGALGIIAACFAGLGAFKLHRKK